MGGEGKSPGTEGPMTEQWLLEELTEALRRGDVTRFNTLRKRNQDKRLEFRDLKLTTGILNLVGINLSGCTLYDITFDGLNLTNAKFNNAIFFACSFQRTDLSGTQFRSCRFDRNQEGRTTQFDGASGYGTDFSNATFLGTRLGPVTFRQCIFNDARFVNVRECRTLADLERSTFHNATFTLDPNSPGYFPEPELSFAVHLSPEQESQLKKGGSSVFTADHSRQATGAAKAKESVVNVADEPALDLSAPASTSASLTPPDSHDQTSLATASTEGEIAMAQQEPSLQDKIAAKAKSAFGIGLNEAEEGLFRATCETVVELGRDGLVKLIDEVAPLSVENREKLSAFFNTETGKGVAGAVISGLLASPLVEMIPGISPRAVKFIQDSMASEIRKGTVFKPAAKSGIKLFLTGPLKQVFDTITGFTSLVERRISVEERGSDPGRLEQPRSVIDDFQRPPVVAATAPNSTNGQQND